MNNDEPSVAAHRILAITPDYIELTVGVSNWQLPNGRFILEEDFKVSGEIWRVHLNDADPYPSKPHAHCVGGSDRFIGCTLHLGSGALYRKRTAMGRSLARDQFDRLIELIRPKFPGVILPIP
jgi:hypothetical protein